MNVSLLKEAIDIFEVYGALAPVHIDGNYLIVASEAPTKMAARDQARLDTLGWVWDEDDNNWLFLA